MMNYPETNKWVDLDELAELLAAKPDLGIEQGTSDGADDSGSLAHLYIGDEESDYLQTDYMPEQPDSVITTNASLPYGMKEPMPEESYEWPSEEDDKDGRLIIPAQAMKSAGHRKPSTAGADGKPRASKNKASGEGVMNKYGAKRTWSELCQRTFDSKAEARRGEELALLERAGEITNLSFQVPYRLCDKPKITVTIDFRYCDEGEWHNEDVKGVLTRDSRTKYAWLAEKHGVHVELIR